MMADLSRAIRRIAKIDAKKKSEIDKIDEMLKALQARREAAVKDKEKAVEESFGDVIRPTLDKMALIFREECESHVRKNYRLLGAFRFSEERERQRFQEIAAVIFKIKSDDDQGISGKDKADITASDNPFDDISDKPNMGDSAIKTGLDANHDSRDPDK